MLHHNETEVANIFESPVTTDQILGRSLRQAWILAMSQAIQVCVLMQHIFLNIIKFKVKYIGESSQN